MFQVSRSDGDILVRIVRHLKNSHLWSKEEDDLTSCVQLSMFMCTQSRCVAKQRDEGWTDVRCGCCDNMYLTFLMKIDASCFQILQQRIDVPITGISGALD